MCNKAMTATAKWIWPVKHQDSLPVSFFPASSDIFITTVLLIFLPTKQFKQLPPEWLRHTMLATFPAIPLDGKTVSAKEEYIASSAGFQVTLVCK